MTRVIWKFPFKVADAVEVRMPAGAKVLSVQTQNGTPCIWALVDPSEPLVSRTFRLYGTGHPIDGDPGEHVATFQMHGGALVFHLFRPVTS